MKLDKIYGIRSEENTSADIIPGQYFNFAFANIEKAENWLKQQENDIGCEFLLVNLEILIMLSKRFPNIAARKIYVLKRKQLIETFEA